MPIYMISYHNDYFLPHAFYEYTDANAKMEDCISKEWEHFKAIGVNYTKKQVAKHYEIFEVEPDEDLYDEGRNLIIAEIEKNL